MKIPRLKLAAALCVSLAAVVAVAVFTSRGRLKPSGEAPRPNQPAALPRPAARDDGKSAAARPASADTPARRTGGESAPAAPGSARPLSDGQRARLRRKFEAGLEREARRAGGARRTPYDKPNEAAEYYRRKRLPEGERELPVERLIEARERARGMRRYSTARESFVAPRAESDLQSEAALEALGAWTSLGPGNVGGRTRALLIHPQNPQVMYAAGVSGGVWKTTNGGASWSPLADLMANIAVCSMAMDPRNPEVIYAGTGEGFFNYGGVRGAGIFRTADGGASWAQLSSTNTSDFHYVNDLAVSPHDSRRIYAATGTGVWRSLDGGASWSRVLRPVDAQGEPVIGGAVDLVIRTDQPTDYVFASCALFEQATVYRNTDAAGAGAWTAVHTEAQMGRTSLALAPSNQNVIYAVAASLSRGDYEDGLHAVFRSTSAGEPGSWTAQIRNTSSDKLGTLLLTNPVAASLRDCGFETKNVFISQGSYDNVIAVDPTDPNRVWVGGIDLFRSDDGGATWGLASHWWAEKSAAQYAHADQHAIAFHPQYNGTTNKVMFVGNDGGLFKTDDARAGVAAGAGGVCNPAAGGVRWTSLNNGYGVTQFYHGLPSPDGLSFFGGTQDNGTLRGVEGGANGWQEVLGGDGGYVAVDPARPNVVFASQPGGEFYKSTDGGATFGRATFGLTDDGLFFVAPLVMDPSNPQVLWAGGKHVWRSDRGGGQWRQTLYNGGGGISYNFVTALAVAASDSNRVLAGAADGAILRSATALAANAPAYWNDPNPHWQATRPRQGFVSGLAFDPQNPDTAYATYSTYGGAHVWKSSDGGASWSPIDGFGAGALPDVPVLGVAVDPANAQRLYVGTDLGVFVSLDGGASWAVENTGFANVSTESLAIINVNGANWLYAFTHGRGAWRVRLGAACAYTLSSSEQSFGAAGGSGGVGVSAAGGCNWSAGANASGAGWITVNQSGAGVSFTVAANNTFKARVGTIKVADRSFAVRQEANRDTTPPAVTIASPAASGTFVATSASITLSGTATDDNQLATVIVKSDRQSDNVGYSTSANWSTSSLQLQPGANTFTVTATDAAGNVGTARLTVLYKPEYAVTRINGQRAERVAVGLDGNVYLTTRSQVYRVNADNSFTAVVGSPSGSSNYPPFNGLRATEAALLKAEGVTADRAGNVYVSDQTVHQIHKITPAGLIFTVAGNANGTSSQGGYGGDGGPATQARLNGPRGMAADDAGNLYFADEMNFRVRRIRPDGTIDTVFGNGDWRTVFPRDVAYDGAGNLYIADTRRVFKLNTGTGAVTHVAGSGADGSGGDGGPALQAQFRYITGVAADRAGNLFISDLNNYRVQRVGGDGIIRTVAGAGALAVAADGAGAVYVAEQSGIPASIIKLLPLTADNTPPTVTITNPGASYVGVVNYINLEGTAGDNLQLTHVTWSNDRGGGGTAEMLPAFIRPGGFKRDNLTLKPGVNRISVTAWDVAGNSTTAVSVVNYPEAVGVTTLAGTRGAGGAGGENVPGVESQLWSPETVAVDAAGNVCVADRGNHTVRKITPAGVITTVAGTGQVGAGGDGGRATAAELNQPGGLAFDSAGNLYIADSENHRVRRVTPDGIISTFAGTGQEGYGGDGGPALQARFRLPVGLAFDAAGNLFIADAGNNRVRRVTPGGTVSTVAGRNVGGFSGDGGPALDAQLNFPTAVAFDPAGHLYISDTSNHCVRRVDKETGVITTYAGVGGSPGYEEFGNRLNQPGGIAFNQEGVLFICDQFNDVVTLRRTSGGLATVVGNWRTSQEDFGALYTVRLSRPAGVAVDAAGNVVIADTGNHRVLRVELRQGVTSTNAAHYRRFTAARGALLTAFGTNLATTSQGATSLPLPPDLGGSVIRVVPFRGPEYRAPLVYVSPTQVNYVMPDVGGLTGLVTLTFVNARGEATSEAVWVEAVAPGIFTASQTGAGVPAANVVRGRGGANTYETAFQLDAQNRYVPRPIDLGPETDVVVLELYGTGFRNVSAQSAVSVKIGGVAAEVLYAGPQANFAGLDQLNVRVPRSVAGRGEVDVVVTAEGKQANTVKIHVR
jgi:uncharacterized protein (TIGR03437 family)